MNTEHKRLLQASLIRSLMELYGITEVDLAAELGVSQPRVSFILNNFSRIRESTRQRFVRAVKRLLQKRVLQHMRFNEELQELVERAEQLDAKRS